MDVFVHTCILNDSSHRQPQGFHLCLLLWETLQHILMRQAKMTMSLSKGCLSRNVKKPNHGSDWPKLKSGPIFDPVLQALVHVTPYTCYFWCQLQWKVIKVWIKHGRCKSIRTQRPVSEHVHIFFSACFLTLHFHFIYKNYSIFQDSLFAYCVL